MTLHIAPHFHRPTQIANLAAIRDGVRPVSAQPDRATDRQAELIAVMQDYRDCPTRLADDFAQIAQVTFSPGVARMIADGIAKGVL